MLFFKGRGRGVCDKTDQQRFFRFEKAPHVGIMAYVHRKTREQTPEQIKQWLIAAVEKLWPVAAGSISLRRSPCVRERCSACESGEGHPAYVLDGRRRGRRFSLYVPEDLTGRVSRAIKNGRALEELIMEAGRRYTVALKQERQLKQGDKKAKRRKKGGRKA